MERFQQVFPSQILPQKNICFEAMYFIRNACKALPFSTFQSRVLLLQRNVFEFIQGFYTDKVNREVRDVKK